MLPDLQDVFKVPKDKQVTTCAESLSLQAAAALMAHQRIGSLIITDEQRRPRGIITDTDFSRKVAAKGVSLDKPVKTIMSSPVRTARTGATLAELILLMIRHQVRHLVLTEDGTPHSPLTAVISERDLLMQQGRSPVGMVRRMQKAVRIEELAAIRRHADKLIYNYLAQELPIPFIAHVITEINDALIQRVVELSLLQLENEGFTRPPLRFAWLSLGSGGRGEQLLQTDQDNALIYEDPSEEDAPQASIYFLRLAATVNSHLEICGFARCPAGIMGSTPDWNQSMKVWEKKFADWIHVPEPSALLNSSIFFDFRCTYGDPQLADDLSGFIHQEIRQAKRFMHFLAQNAVDAAPPLGFFRTLLLSRGGEPKGKFDLKLRAMMPLTDAARVLALAHQLKDITNTIYRFERMAAMEPDHQALFSEAAKVYGLYMKHRALSGFRHQDSGRFIDPGELSKLERKMLKYSFSTLKDIQQVLKSRFDLSLY